MSIGDPDQADHARADATAALALLDARTRPLAAANARLVLAEICETEGDVGEALAHATEALSVATRARYQLPSSKWRAQWSSRQLDVFATALRLADKAGDSCACRKLRPCRSRRTAILVDDSAEKVLWVYGEAFDLIGFDRLEPGPQRCSAGE